MAEKEGETGKRRIKEEDNVDERKEGKGNGKKRKGRRRRESISPFISAGQLNCWGMRFVFLHGYDGVRLCPSSVVVLVVVIVATGEMGVSLMVFCWCRLEHGVVGSNKNLGKALVVS